MLNTSKLSDRNILTVGLKILIDRKYRAHILNMIRAYTGASRLKKEEEEQLSVCIKKKSFYFVGGCELHPICQYLRNSGINNIYFTFEQGGNPNTYFEINNPDAEYQKNHYDIFVLSQAQEFRELVKKVQLYNLEIARDDLLAELDQYLSQLKLSIEKIVDKYENASIFLYGYAVSYLPALGIFEYAHGQGTLTVLELLNRYNQGMYDIADSMSNIYIIDHYLINRRYSSQDFVKRHTQDGIYDHLSDEAYRRVTQLFLKQLEILYGQIKRVKCIVCDLDNTLWNGILQDLGPDGIGVRHFCVNVLRMLARRGILIALCSKNEPQVKELLPGILGEEFMEIVSVAKINWEPKPKNMHEIARLLNIGLDSIAFIDDNPFEREQVQKLIPEIRVYDENVFPDLLIDKEFEPAGKLTKESTDRAELYKQQARRKIAEESFQGQYTDFLISCEMKVSFELAKKNELERMAELIERTNQLNTSVKRYKKNELAKMLVAEDWIFYRLRVKDKFGDYGLVGVCILQTKEESWSIDLMTLSCRIMGRGLEAFIFNTIKHEASKLGVKSIELGFRQTERNTAMKKIVVENGFTLIDGETTYKYDVLKKETLKIPKWIDLS